MRYRFSDIEVDTDTFELRVAGAAVALEPQVFDVLVHLIVHRSRVVPKEELLDQVWGDRFVSESALSSRIMSARRAVGDDGRRQSVIKTIHGRGFRFVAEVQELPNGSSLPASPAAAAADVVLRRAPRTRYVHGPGGATAYQVVGDGPADLVFVPGFVSNVELQWEFPPMAAFFSRLASFARLIVFDKRGTGLSERLPPGATLSLEERMGDVCAVMDAAGSTRATLMGISEGGPMSVLFAASHPERVERLVLVNTFASSFLQDIGWRPGDIAELWGTGSVYSYLAPSWNGHPDDTRFLARYERNSASPSAALACVEMNGAIDVRPALAAIEAPTLVMHRRGDQVVRFERGVEIAEGISDARLLALDGDDHLAFADAARILDETEAFVTGTPPAQAWDRTLATVLDAQVVEGGVPASPAALDQMASDASAEVRHAGGTILSVGPGGTVATFDGPARAIRAGLGLLACGARLGVDIRCGVHTGEVQHRGGRPVGIPLDVARDVARLAGPNEIWTTTTVRDLVTGSGLEFEARGEHLLCGSTDARQLFAAR